MELLKLVKQDNQSTEKKEKIQVDIPYDWWSTTNLISFTLKESSTNQAVGHKSLPNTPGWDIKKGDYRVRDTKVKNLDYIYYRNLRLKMLKYLLYPGILFTIIFVFVILRMFVKV